MSEQTFIQRKKVTNKRNINTKKQTKLQQAIFFFREKRRISHTI